MKKIFLIVTLTLVPVLGFSQECVNCPIEGGRHGGHYHNNENWSEQRQQMRDKMSKELNLSDAQIKQINVIDDKYKTQEDALRGEAETLYNKRKDLRDKKRTEIEKVLNDEQKSKLNNMSHNSHGRTHMGRGR